MRTLKFLKRDRQIANAKETMEIYAPLANRLGLYSMKWELEDLSFKYLHPDEYHELVEGINKKREERGEEPFSSLFILRRCTAADILQKVFFRQASG